MPVPVHLPAALAGLALNVAGRPDLTADMIAEIIDVDWHWLVHSLALNPLLPDAVRLRLARHADSAVRAALVIGTGADGSRDVFELLIDDPDPKVRRYLAESEHVPDELRAALADDPNPEVRATLARWWPQAPEQVRRALLTDADDDVRAAACSTYYARLPHPVPPLDLIPALIADPATRVGVIRHVNLDQDTAVLLAEDPNPSVRVAIFGRADTPEPMRAAIHAGIDTYSSALAEVFDRRGPALDEALHNVLAGFRLGQLRPDWVTADPLPHVNSPYRCFRAAAAACPTLPPEAVRRLLNDADSTVRTTMARHAPHLVDLATAECVDRQFQPEKRTTWRPADDVAFPPETLRRFATDPDHWMRCLAPRDHDLPSDLAERLATDSHSSVRLAVARHRNLPATALTGLLADENESVVRAAGGSPHLPVAQMERLLALAEL